MALNNKQRKFIDEYLKDMNATQAAIRAGYSASTAKQQGSRLLTNVDVENEIKRRQAISSNKADKTREQVIKDLQTVIDMYLTAGRNTPNALKAIDMLSKLQGWYSAEKQEVTIKSEQPLFGPKDDDQG